jgi:hypothetical protein
MGFIAESASATISLQGLADEKIGSTLSSLPPLLRSATFPVVPESLPKNHFGVAPLGPSGCYHRAVAPS